MFSLIAALMGLGLLMYALVGMINFVFDYFENRDIREFDRKLDVIVARANQDFTNKWDSVYPLRTTLCDTLAKNDRYYREFQ